MVPHFKRLGERKTMGTFAEFFVNPGKNGSLLDIVVKLRPRRFLLLSLTRFFTGLRPLVFTVSRIFKGYVT